MMIRPAASLAEVDLAYEIERISYPPEAAATREAFRARFAVFPAYFLIAETEGEIVGVTNGVRLRRRDLSDEGIKQPQGFQPDGNYFCILTVAVAPAHRRRGIAKRLVRQLLEQARNDRLAAVLLMCEEHLVPFYESLGFRYVKPSASAHGGIQWHEMECGLRGDAGRPL